MKNKKIVGLVILVVLIIVLSCCYFMTRIYIEGTTTTAIRIGMNPNDKFSEAIEEVPVGEKSSILIVTNLQSNKQRKAICKIVVTLDKTNIIDYDEGKTSGCLKNSINISDDKKTIEYQAEVSRNTSSIPIKLQFNFMALESGESMVKVKVYDHKGDIVLSACADMPITFE